MLLRGCVTQLVQAGHSGPDEPARPLLLRSSQESAGSNVLELADVDPIREPSPWAARWVLESGVEPDVHTGSPMSFVVPSAPNPDDQARWPDRVLALSQAWQRSATDDQRRRILAELWTLVNAAVTRYVRLHSQSYGHVAAEDVRDIASEKAVAFIRSLENGARDLGELQSSQVCSYLSILARNGLVDALRKSHGRTGEVHEEEKEGTPVAPESDGAEINLRHHEFLRAICGCVSSLAPRAQTAWFLRAFLDMPSKKIAGHPDVRMTPTAVDMMLSRTRRALSECMEKKGLDPGDAPPGTFVALWELLNARETSTKEGKDNAPPLG